MKYFIYALLIGCIVFSTAGINLEPDSINKVIGNESYLSLKGEKPNDNISETARISIHLAYVEDILRKKDISHLSEQQKVNRAKNIEFLNEYRTNEKYPSNYDYKGERRPCFKDMNDRICAVGYLVEQNGGEELVNEIQSSMNYAYIEDMNIEDLALWVENSGLTLEECAMIQPTYMWVPSPDLNYVSPGYTAASAALTGFNVASTAIGFIQINNNGNQWLMPALGIGSGISQLTIGSININKYEDNWNVYKRHENLSMANIAIGTFSVALNSYSLIRSLKGKKQQRDLTWNAYAFPSQNAQVNFGFNLVKRL